MSKKTTSSALVVLADRELVYSAAQLPKLQAIALEQLEMVGKLQKESSVRAILAGLTLHRVKASTKHGEWMPWLKNNIRGIGQAQVNNYMRLAQTFIERAKVTKPDILAIPGDQMAIEAMDEARGMMTKLNTFVGDRSLADLFDKYHIKENKSRGGKRDKDEDNDGHLSEPLDPSILAAQKRDELSAWIEEGKRLLLDENAAQHLQTEDINAFHGAFANLSTEWTKHVKGLLKNSTSDAVTDVDAETI